MRHISEGGVRNFGQDPELGTTSVSRKGDTTKSGYLIFDPSGMSSINWRKLDQESESNNAYRVETNKSTKEIL